MKSPRSNILRLAFAVVLLSFSLSTMAQNSREAIKGQIFSDTLGVSKAFQKTELQSHSFYDTMRNSKSWVVRTIANLLIGSRSSADDAYAVEDAILSRDYFDTFQGKIITKINIVNANIFSRTDEDDLSWTERALDNLHVKTRYGVVQKNLLFKVGDKLNPYTMSINEQLIRGKDYISTAFFILIPDKKHPNGVIVNVFTRDNWTISAGGALGGNPRLDVFDRNFLGSGNMLKFIYYPKTSNQYDAFEAQYAVNNLWGTFANATIHTGVGATNSKIMLEVDRPFILPTDHFWGTKMGFIVEPQGFVSADSTISAYREFISIFYGFSLNLNPKKGTTAYWTIAPSFINYKLGAKVGPTLNPYYSTRLDVLTSVGISQNNYLQGNMIYGYGKIEDIPYGFKFELTGGWQTNVSLGKRWYLGALARWGNYNNSGYYDLSLGAGTFFTNDQKMQQSTISGRLNYFSPLIEVNSMYIRQFINMSYTHGFHRLDGERELLSYGGYSGIRGVYSPYYARGKNRFTVNAETVLFTPIFFYHFRFAFFGWFDMGWLGNDNVFYKNEFSSAIGLGVRVKNERLIFNNIQLRFGVSLSRPSGSSFNWFDVTNEQYLRIQPYIPQPATVVEFN